MEEWIRCKIGDVCNTISDTYRGNADKVVLVNTSDVLNGKCLNHLKSANKDLKGQFKKTFQIDDILYSEIRPANKRFAYIDFDGTDYIASTKLMVIRHNENILPQYLYYIITSQAVIEELQMLAESRSGTFPQITFSELAILPIELPPLSEQIKIVRLLKSLDDKIEVNRRINDNLEQQAQALFKSWFVDFEPFRDQPFVESELGMIPEGWRVGTLGGVCECLLGGTPSRNHDEYWNGNIPWINSGEVNNFRILNPTEFITQEGLENSATKLLPAHTTVLAITGATLGQVSLLEIKSCANQSVIGVLENTNIPYCFIYPLIKQYINELMSHMTGGAQQHINKNNVEQLKIVLPPHSIIKKYNYISVDLFNRITNCCFQSNYLSRLRDTLLPRLMSGELEVKDIEQSL